MKPTVAAAVRNARERAGLSVRALARKAGVSHTQISRLEAGEVRKPSRDVLVSVSQALDRNPTPLLILAGYLSVEESSNALRGFFRPGAELPQEWGDWATWSVAEVNQMLRDPKASAEQIERIASDVFFVEETDETLWGDSYALASARGEDAQQLQELMAIWRFLPRDSRQRWLEIGTRLRDLADLDFRIEQDLIDRQATIKELVKGKHG